MNKNKKESHLDLYKYSQTIQVELLSTAPVEVKSLLELFDFIRSLDPGKAAIFTEIKSEIKSEINVDKSDKCPRCSGVGAHTESTSKRECCEVCMGSGKIQV